MNSIFSFFTTIFLLVLLLNGCAHVNKPANYYNYLSQAPINHLSPTPLKYLTSISNIKVDKVKMIKFINALDLQNPQEKYTLNIYQTPNRNQVGNDGKDTGACPTFAMIAAIEAFYKRECMNNNPGINPNNCNIDLSEEYFIHLNSHISTLNSNISQENFSSYCGVVRGKREDWGGPGGFGSYLDKALPTEIGQDGVLVSVTAKNNFAKQTDLYHQCKETELTLAQDDIDSYEYDYNHFSADLRKRAQYAVKQYLAVDFFKPEDIEKLIYNKHEVIAGHGWGHLVKTGTDADALSIYEYDSNNGCFPTEQNGKCGGHAILVIGYDKINKRYLVKNSYGPGSNYWIPYFTDDGVTPVLWNGQSITQVRDVKLKAQRDAQWVGVWNMDHDGWLGKLVIRRTMRSPNENNAYQGIKSTPLGAIADPPRIGTYYDSDNHNRPVYGFTSLDGYRLTIYVDFNTDSNSYSDKLGDVTSSTQKFEFYIFDNADAAAGVTYWNHKRFGSFISRPDININHITAGSYDQNNWIGFWTVNISDVVEGNLHISSVNDNSIDGIFYYNNKALPISGTLTNNYAMFKITFEDNSSEYLNLFFHTRENDFISGFTKSNKGVYLVRRLLDIPPESQQLIID